MKPIIQTTGYSIQFTHSAGESIDQFIEAHNYSSVFVLMDENVMQHCWPIIQFESKSLENVEILLVDAGEEQKDIEIATQLWHSLIEAKADRASLLINIGGGMISDLGGFVASTYKRGIDFINIPTSLLSMVDASIGGKTAVNLHHLKNQVGVFCNPKAIYIQTDFLKTLDPRQMLSGWAEMLKHGLIADENHWNKLIEVTELSIENIAPHIPRSIEIKKEIVEQDPQEKNIRKKLNFGHSLGHIIESFSLENDSDHLLHGEAVAIGMIMESYLSVKLNGLSKDALQLISAQIGSFFNKYEIQDQLIAQSFDYLLQDKKKEGNELNLTFVSAIGESVINQNCKFEDIIESINYYKDNC